MKYLKFLPVVAVVLIGMILGLSYIKANPNPYPESVPDSEVPKYEEVELPHEHIFDSAKFLPVIGSAIIDVDSDGVPELFLGGGVGQADAFLPVQKQSV